MRIKCAECRTDFELPPKLRNPDGGKTQCPFCHTGIEIRPENEEGVQHAYFSSKKLLTRSCTKCAKEFVAQAKAAIPVCPECNKEDSGSYVLETQKKWKVHLGDQILEVESEADFRKYILQDVIFPRQRVELPNGSVVLAGHISEFRNAFLVQRNKGQSRSESTFSRRTLSRWLRPAILLQGMVLVVSALALAWLFYRVATYSPSRSGLHPSLEQILANLKARNLGPSKSFPTLMNEANTLLKKDQPDEYAKAQSRLERALLLKQDSAKTLGLLAITVSHSAQFGSDARLRLTALDLADLAIELHPLATEGYVAKARAALNASDVKMALEASKKALELDPGNVNALVTRASVEISAAEGKDGLLRAVHLTEKAIQLDNQFLEAYSVMGEAYLRLAQPENAWRTYELRLAEAPEDPRSYFAMGNLEYRSDHFPEAKEWFQQSLRSNSRLVSARLQLALIYRYIEKKDEMAERHLRGILGRYKPYANASEIAQAQKELIKILLDTERGREAKVAIDQLLAVSKPRPELYVLKARVLESEGKIREALEKLEEGMGQSPSNLSLRFALARMRERHASADEAIRAYRSVLELRPNWLPPYFFLTRLFIQLNRKDEAMDSANTAVTRSGFHLNPNLWVSLSDRDVAIPWESFERRFQTLRTQNKGQAFVHAFKGLLHFYRGVREDNSDELKKSLTLFAQAKKMAKSLEYPLVLEGHANTHLNRWKEASKAFEAVNRKKPDQPSIAYWIANAQIKTKNWKKAETFLAILESKPDWLHRFEASLGDIAWAKKEEEDAIKHWHASLQLNPLYLPPWRALIKLARNN